MHTFLRTLCGAGTLILWATTATAAPAYQMPFACGETWSLTTFSHHNPLRAVDMNRSGDLGDPVVAAAAGTVSVRRDLGNSSYGRYLVVNHGSGHDTLYAHLQSFSVSVGQSVRQGQRLGYVGNTGGSQGPHLHFEERYQGSAQPIRFDGRALPYYGTVSWTSRNSCGGGNVTGVVNTNGTPLNVRSGPGTGYSVVGTVADGATVTIQCQMPGTTVTGPYGTSSIWDRIGSGRYISDAYVRTGSDGYVAPRCP
ncbi:MAG: peptidoglycan DD-metalloendopeptidase family protein [Xanthomonadales bacterium]|nr:hypothetical protein [Xanthomonadales bacterium]MCC6592073.1 peptidoglycan DD-metalloendopeptidase family protein [Xanthomonadales bacterium]MCE7931772.1 M23 family peptidase [Xanthomonadales bacterium PRO6]